MSRKLKVTLTPELLAAMNMAVGVERQRVAAILDHNAKVNDVLAGEIVGADGAEWHKHFAQVLRDLAMQVRSGR